MGTPFAVLTAPEPRRPRAKREEVPVKNVAEKVTQAKPDQSVPPAWDAMKDSVRAAVASQLSHPGALATSPESLRQAVDAAVIEGLRLALETTAERWIAETVGADRYGVTRPHLVGRWEGVEGKVRFGSAARAGAVVEHEAVAVRGKHKRDVERCGVFKALLHPVADAVRIVLRLDERLRNVGFEIQNVTGALGLTATDELAAHDYSALGEADLLADL